MKPISEMRRVCEAATEGPWCLGDEHETMATVVTEASFTRIAQTDVDNIIIPGTEKRTRDNAAFIAEARTQWPLLIEWTEKARKIFEMDVANGYHDDRKELLEELPE